MRNVNKFLIEGLDRLGKDTLIQGIKDKRGFHHVLHFSKPELLACYEPSPTGMTAKEMTSTQQYEYQTRGFRNMFMMLKDPYTHLILNRAHLGECVYAPLYRGYDGEYVFGLERQYRMDEARNCRLILLTEDFKTAKHFVDDGESFDITKREREQELFLAAFENSIMPDKRVLCVTDPTSGSFKPKAQVVTEALA